MHHWPLARRPQVHGWFGWMRTVIRPRILLADDHAEFLEAAVALLCSAPR